MDFRIDYDAVKFEVKTSSNPQRLNDSLKDNMDSFNQKRITEWFKKFLEVLKETVNGSKIKLLINGINEYDQKVILEILGEQNREWLSYKIENVQKEQDIVSKFKLIDDFISTAFNSKSPIIRDAFDVHKDRISALNNTIIEVPVIATMSSGKSTLLNALIGRDLLPALNRATTATTCEIIINNDLKNFKGVVVEEVADKILSEESTITPSFINEWNKKANDNNKIKIIIEGPVQEIDTKEFELHFVDTPGPNNSRNNKHTESTYTYLKDSQNLPIILYLLNATQLEITDDQAVLNEISKVIKDNLGNLDRIIFIVNKIDELKVNSKDENNRESVGECLIRVKDYLKGFGINDPKLFPVSANYAKLSQLDLDEDDDDFVELDALKKKFKPNPDKGKKGYQLVENSSLLPKQKEELLRRLTTDDDVSNHLIYSGLESIKLYISDYIENHHKAIKYKELRDICVSVFGKIEASINVEREVLKELSDNEKAEISKKHHHEIEDIKEKKNIILDNIKNIKVKDKTFFRKANTKIVTEFGDIKNDFLTRKEISMDVASSIIKDINKTIQNLKISVKTDLDSKIAETISGYLIQLKDATKISLGKSEDVYRNYFNMDFINKVDSLSYSNLNKYHVGVKEYKTIKKKRKIYVWYKPRWIFGDQYEEYDDVQEINRSILNKNEYYARNIQPIGDQFVQIINDYEEKFNEILKSVNEMFYREVSSHYDSSLKLSESKYNNSISNVEADKKELEKDILFASKEINKYKNII